MLGKEKYYKLTENLNAHQEVIELVEKLNKKGVAIDLGCGAGRDTVYLIKNGWRVIAIDSINTSEIINTKLNSTENKNLDFVERDFVKVDLPENDLTVAYFSLQFCKKDDFYELWQRIRGSINKSRIFCGYLFRGK
ncbi:MAG: methyltransferase domain-containing protein [Clostridia bacterium]|nr:methyltransferase domain-containing protein [Clostridia bacterium]